LASDLAALADVRLDVRGARSNRSTKQELGAALQDIDGVVLVWSHNTVSSPGVALEIESANRLGVPIFPCLIRRDPGAFPALPEGLPLDAAIDYSNESLGFGGLCMSLLERLDPAVNDVPSEVARPADLDVVIGYLRDSDSHNSDTLVARVINALELVKSRDERAVVQLEEGMALVQQAQEAVDRPVANRHELEAILVAVAAQERVYPGLMHRVRQLIEARLRDLPAATLEELEIPTLTTDPYSDEQLRIELTAFVGPDRLDRTLEQVSLYLVAAPDTLRALHRMAEQRRAAVVSGVVQSAVDYFSETDDLLPDHYGVLGRLDDAWLVHNLAYRVVEAGLVTADGLGENWLKALRADVLVRELLSGEVLHGLEALLLQWMDELATEVVGYEPHLPANASGHHEPVMPLDPSPDPKPVSTLPPRSSSKPDDDDQNDWDTPEVSMFLGMFGLAVSMFYSLPVQSTFVRVAVAVGVLVLSIPAISLGARGLTVFVRVLSNPKTFRSAVRETRHERVAERHADAHRWANSLAWLVAMSVGIGIFIFWIGPSQQLELDRAELKISIAEAAAVAEMAQDALAEDEIDKGLLFALEAYRIAPTVDAMDALVTGLEGSSRFTHQLAPPIEGNHSIAASPDWRWLAVGRMDGSIQVFDMETSESVRIIEGHGDAVTSIAFRPDGRQIVTGDESGTVAVWDLSSGSEVGPELRTRSAVRSLSINADGSTLVTTGADSLVRALELSVRGIGDELERVPVGAVFEADVSPDGESIAVAGKRELGMIENGAMTAVGRNRVETRHVAFNREGTLLMSADGAGGLWRWNPKTGRGEEVAAHDAPITRVVFADDVDIGASIDADDVLKVWSVDLRSWTQHLSARSGSSVTDVAISPDGLVVITTGSTGINVYDVGGADRLSSSYPSSGGPAWAVDIGPGDRYMAAGAVGGVVSVWTIEGDVDLVNQLDAGESTVRSVAFAESGELVVGTGNGSVLLWGDPLQGGDPATMGRHDGGVREVAFLAGSARVISGGTDGIVAVWNADRVIGEHTGAVRSIAPHPEGERVASGGEDTVVSVWTVDGDRDRSLPDLHEHEGELWTVTYSPDGEIIASGGEGEKIVLSWPDRDTSEEIAVVGDPGNVRALEFSPDGLILAAGIDNAVQLFDVATQEPIGPPLTGHRDGVRDLSFSSDGARLATASPDGTIRIWQTDPLSWAELACEVAGRNLSAEEWEVVRRDQREINVSHCTQFPGNDNPVDAQYGSPSSLGVSRQIIAADRSIVIVLIVGVVLGAVYIASQLIRSRQRSLRGASNAEAQSVNPDPPSR
jgi:WD40 repeat protein